jgi:hypothetical protein
VAPPFLHVMVDFMLIDSARKGAFNFSKKQAVFSVIFAAN